MEEKGEVIEKKRGGFGKSILFTIRILFSVFLGFLPSFLFIALFIQYGSPITNYLNFLSNWDSSMWAWISALGIAFFLQIIISAFRNNTIKKILKNKAVLTFFILSILIILSLVALQLYLYVNFVLRNDILVRLSADQENIFFTDNSQEQVDFKISVTMNPFCSAKCDFTFFDISNGKEIDRGEFNLTSIFSKTKTYTLENLHLVEGSQILERFQVNCKSEKTLLCYTSGQESSRSVLITVNYDLSEEGKIFKNDSKEQIVSISTLLSLSEKKLNASALNVDSINSSFSIVDFSQRLGRFFEASYELKSSLLDLADLWETQNFDKLSSSLPIVSKDIQTLYSGSENISLEINSSILAYNTLINDLTNLRNILTDISRKNLSAGFCTSFNNVVQYFNSKILQFEEETSLSVKISLVESLSSQISEIYNQSQQEISEIKCVLSEQINDSVFSEIKFPFFNFEPTPISITDPSPICCFYGECGGCCDDSCSNTNYPVIFLHGQSINEALPADYSFDTFLKIKKQLVSENYVDAGSIILSKTEEESGLWGKLNNSMIMTASYFFDVYKTETGEQTVSSNTGSIDTYAIRLNSIVELVKSRTNKDKVILVAHSMGGVVARRYVQIFGGNDVQKMILITVPNHGVDGMISDYCAVIGPEASCNDLDKDSILMNKLNAGKTDIVPIYNIVGVGCDMGDDTGDGIIKNSSQYLNSANNYYFNGKCNELSFGYFHEFIIDSDEYPAVYTLIKNLLKDQND